MQAVILAGGLGTRLRPLTLDVPKPMVPVAGRPFLDYELRLLTRNGFHDFVICVGYRADQIERYFGNGSELGISIAYSNDGEKQLGPSGALTNAAKLLKNEFMVTYGDAFLQMNYRDFEESFRSSGKLGMMAVLDNHNSFGNSDIVVKDGLVVEYDKTNQKPEMTWINFGATMLQKRALGVIPASTVLEEEQFYRALIAKRELAAFVTTNRFYEIGTIPALREFEKFVIENPKLLI